MPRRRSIPESAHPEWFAEAFAGEPRDPAPARPAATVVLARDGASGPEVLLLRRTRRSGFVPGAWVFPGGRVDRADGAPSLVARIRGLNPGDAATRLRLPDAEPPAVAYYLAAVREAFEETGILVGAAEDGSDLPDASRDPTVDELRIAVLQDERSLLEACDHLGCLIAGDRIAYLAHWITPVVEPRRYDTRFFLARVPTGSEAVIDAREMTEAKWLTPADALGLQDRGELPMIFPTIHTLEHLAPFADTASALEDARTRDVPTILPRLVRTATGVALEIPDD